MESVSGTAAVAGWYADPTGSHEYRYWDGSRWTADVADAGHAFVDPLDNAEIGITPDRIDTTPGSVMATGMSEPEKAFLINVFVAIVLPPWILVTLIWWSFFRKRTPSHPSFRRFLGTEVMVGAALYALFALLMVFVSFAAKMPTVAPGTPSQVFEMAEAGDGLTSGRLWERAGFQTDFIALTQDAAEHLVSLGVLLVGIDYLSIEPYEAGTACPVHRTLLGAGAVVIEGVDLRDVPPGEYVIACAPLRLVGAEGSPARVFLIDMGAE